ncbi:hydroxymethylbilane synthase [Sporomusaceae bacterium BoRhaA]|uniref:hydroxymethylbilane synthase n=1 Tax=Pelorhabdus rhamnosifermentans TaxID=2772457 RepID=UPI001C063D79|nr:hydroxymethylbilane synthase [Pelorhabdus rhamnosifermentans]MBU2702515.1 hydroxymethylbilane synthase [Pelorhabdus rhamnosifermentans]
MMKQQLVIGTRGSKLALWQAEYIAECLRKQHKELTVTLKHIVTTGDKILDVPLAKIGGKGLFTKELELSMLHGEIDLAVHSLKDMPTELPQGLSLAAITQRADPYDAFVSTRYAALDDLPQGATLGTSSLRRKAQLLHYRPDLVIRDLRGNLDSRLRKLDEGQFDAIILAAAGLKRLGWGERISQILPPEICLPAVGQGALAIEARQGDSEVFSKLEFLNHEPTYLVTTAERAFLRTVEGGCQVPVGVFGQWLEHEICLEAIIASVDGKRLLRQVVRAPKEQATESGCVLAKKMLDLGGRQILDEIR